MQYVHWNTINELLILTKITGRCFILGLQMYVAGFAPSKSVRVEKLRVGCACGMNLHKVEFWYHVLSEFLDL